MIGRLVAATLLPRFSSLVGEGSYATVPLEVEAFDQGNVTFWRGPLVGGAVSAPFTAHIEESHDALVWTTVGGTAPITTAGAVGSIAMVFTKRWLRVRVELDADTNGVVAISLWMAGSFRRRVPPGA